MVVLVAFDNIGGFGCRYLHAPVLLKDELIQLESQITLNNLEASLPALSEGLFVVSRRRLNRAWTWIGAYKPVPENLFLREGDFFGVGIWLPNTMVPGERVCSILEKTIIVLGSRMSKSSTWNLDKLNFRDLKIDQDSIEDRLLPKKSIEGQGLGFDHFEATGVFEIAEEAQVIANAVDDCQSGHRLQSLSRVLIPLDNKAACSIRIRGARVQIGVGLSDQAQHVSSPTPSKRTNNTDRTKAMSQPDEWDVWEKRRKKLNTNITSHFEPVIQYHKEVDDREVGDREMDNRLDHIEQNLLDLLRKSRRATWIAIVSMVFTVCILSSGIFAGVYFIELTEERSFAGLLRHRFDDPSPEGTALGQTSSAKNSVQTQPASSASVVSSSEQSVDFYTALERGLDPISKLLNSTNASNTDETQKKLQKAWALLVDTLQQSPDPKFKAISEKLHSTQRELIRGKTGN